MGMSENAHGAGGAADAQWAYVTFHTTVEAFAFKQACELRGIEGRLRTIPRSLSAGCGLAWESPITRADDIRACLADAKSAIDYEGFHTL